MIVNVEEWERPMDGDSDLPFWWFTDSIDKNNESLRKIDKEYFLSVY